jgi:hypothetical protein
MKVETFKADIIVIIYKFRNSEIQYQSTDSDAENYQLSVWRQSHCDATDR